MDAKKYELKTIKEMSDVVNEKNVDGFLKDFGMWLKLGVSTKRNKIVKFGTDVFIWNDDGEWGKLKDIRIKVIK